MPPKSHLSPTPLNFNFILLTERAFINSFITALNIFFMVFGVQDKRCSKDIILKIRGFISIKQYFKNKIAKKNNGSQ